MHFMKSTMSKSFRRGVFCIVALLTFLPQISYAGVWGEGIWGTMKWGQEAAGDGGDGADGDGGDEAGGDGAGGDGGAGGGADTPTAFIERFYVNILGRPSDQAGLNGWLDIIQTQSASTVSLGFFNSQEFLAKELDNAAFLNILYRTLFNRVGDEAGTAGWLELLESGKLRDMVIYGFLRSNEFKTLSDSFGVTAVSAADNSSYGVRAFTERFYTLVLGRQPDQGGFNGWVTGLATGTLSGGDTARSFFLSAEYLGQNTSNSAFVDTAYQAFFGRQADSAGKQGWLDAMTQGSSRTDVLNGFIGSAEFVALASSYGIRAARVEVRRDDGASPIPTLPVSIFLLLSGLLALFGARRLRAA